MSYEQLMKPLSIAQDSLGSQEREHNVIFNESQQQSVARSTTLHQNDRLSLACTGADPSYGKANTQQQDARTYVGRGELCNKWK